MAVTRDQIFKLASAKLRQDFLELSTVPHNQLKGNQAEALLRKFLNDHLPKRFSAGSGFIIDANDNVSKQTDVLVYDAYNCPVYRTDENAGIYPSDNVAAVVEVKSVLDKARLQEANENIVAAKSLSKTKKDEDAPGPIMAHTIGCVFAFESPLKLVTLAQHQREFTAGAGGLGLHVDYICVLDRGVISLACNMPGLTTFAPLLYAGVGGPKSEGAHITYGAYEFGTAALDLFFRFLLGHLALFREIIPHPGFRWAKEFPGLKAPQVYVTSMTHVTDEREREERLNQYHEDFKARFIGEGDS